jgi:hypothetical protein
VDVDDLPRSAGALEDHALRRGPVDGLTLVCARGLAFGGDPGDVADRGSGALVDGAGNRFREGCVRSKVMRGIFGLAALDPPPSKIKASSARSASAELVSARLRAAWNRSTTAAGARAGAGKTWSAAGAGSGGSGIGSAGEAAARRAAADNVRTN